MNIAFFLNSFPVLSQTFILNQITGLIDSGHNVDIYTYNIRNESVMHSDVERYRLLDRTFCHGKASQIMPDTRFKRIIGVIGQLRKTFDTDRGQFYRSLNRIRLERKSTPLGLIYKANALSKNRDKYDILHCHFGPNGNLVARLKSIGAIKGTLITTFHGFDVSKYIKKHGKDVYDFLFENGDWFLPVSHQMRDQLIRLGCNPEKTRVHHMGIDVTKFHPRGLKTGGTIEVLTVGRLVEKKGIIYGIQAIAEVLKRNPNIKYTIVGDGPLRGRLEEFIAKSGFGDKIQILGSRQQEEVKELMSGADIFLAPSVTDQNGDKEGLPVVLMEALASGLPVVSTKHSAIPELVEDGESGFLVPERNVDALVQRLGCLVEQPELLSRMGRAGRLRVEKEFNIHKLNADLVNLYLASTQEGQGKAEVDEADECRATII